METSRNPTLKAKEAELRSLVRAAGKAVVAFSGGVDSALLAKIAAEETDDPVAVTADSVLVPRHERADAERLAGEIGVRHVFLPFDPLTVDAVRANPRDRCYHCKKAIYRELLGFAKQAGYDSVLDGGNVSDLSDYRPGRKAVEELGVRSPLMEAGLEKDEVRLLSRALGIAGYDRPAAACLASRIPYGRPLVPEDLALADAAETVVRELGFVQVRVRLLDNIACIELSSEELSNPSFFASRRQALADRLCALGFDRVVLDLAGYRTGSLNSLL